MLTGLALALGLTYIGGAAGAGGSLPSGYTPSLNFSDPRNSQYIAAVLADD
jgi:hypothetical protein